MHSLKTFLRILFLIIVSSDQGGQILIRGRNIMMGYLESPAKTLEAFSEDGWLQSGDLGILEDDGCIRVTGRLKELIVTAGGENVPPVLIEENIKEELPCLSHVMLVGDQVSLFQLLLVNGCGWRCWGSN